MNRVTSELRRTKEAEGDAADNRKNNTMNKKKVRRKINLK